MTCHLCFGCIFVPDHPVATTTTTRRKTPPRVLLVPYTVARTKTATNIQTILDSLHTVDHRHSILQCRGRTSRVTVTVSDTVSKPYIHTGSTKSAVEVRVIRRRVHLQRERERQERERERDGIHRSDACRSGRCRCYDDRYWYYHEPKCDEYGRTIGITNTSSCHHHHQ